MGKVDAATTSTRSCGGSSGQGRSDARRNRARLLVAAREAFQEHGTTFQIEDVAARAGIGVGTVYRNFANKDLLIEAVVLDGMIAGRERIRNIDPALPPWEAFCTAVRTLAASTEETRYAVPFVYSLGSSGAVREEIERFYELFVVFVERAQVAGDLRDDLTVYDIAELVVRVISPRLEPISWKPLSDHLSDRLITVVLDGLHVSGRSDRGGSER